MLGSQLCSGESWARSDDILIYAARPGLIYAARPPGSLWMSVFGGYNCIKRVLKPTGVCPFRGYLRCPAPHQGLNTYKSLFETRKTRCFGGSWGPYRVHTGRVTGFRAVPRRCLFPPAGLPLFTLHPIRAKAPTKLHSPKGSFRQRNFLHFY